MNRTVLITGSTRGIGFSTAAEFLRHGDRVVILCRHRKHVADITGQCLKRFGRLDILVNNAGVAVYKPISVTTDEDWDRIIDTNLKGTFLFLRQAIDVMQKQRGDTRRRRHERASASCRKGCHPPPFFRSPCELSSGKAEDSGRICSAYRNSSAKKTFMCSHERRSAFSL